MSADIRYRMAAQGDWDNALLIKIATMLQESLGLNGGRVVTSANGAVTGTFRAIKALGGDVVISAATGNIIDLAGTTISDGDHVPGTFTSVTLTSGTAILFNA